MTTVIFKFIQVTELFGTLKGKCLRKEEMEKYEVKWIKKNKT